MFSSALRAATGEVLRLVAAVALDGDPSRGEEALWCLHLGRHDVAVALELHVADPTLGCRALTEVEADAQRCVNLDGGTACLAVALREVRVARGEHRAFGEHRERTRGRRRQSA